MSVIVAEIKIPQEEGVNDVSAAVFTKLAKSFQAEIVCTVLPKGITFKATSVKQIVKAKIKKDQILQIEARGNDANYAVDALVQLVKNDFVQE